jgi:hypothetical protein
MAARVMITDSGDYTNFPVGTRQGDRVQMRHVRDLDWPPGPDPRFWRGLAAGLAIEIGAILLACWWLL